MFVRISIVIRRHLKFVGENSTIPQNSSINSPAPQISINNKNSSSLLMKKKSYEMNEKSYINDSKNSIISGNSNFTI